MALKIEDKKMIVAEVTEVAKRSVSAVVVDYRGVTVAEMTKMRVKARESNVCMKIIRNTLASRALHDTSFACLSEVLIGPSCIAFSLEEPGAAARLIKEFSKRNENLKVKALTIGGKLFPAKDLNVIAELPSKDQAIALLMGTLLAPVTSLARTLTEPYAKLTRLFAAVAQQKA